MRRELRALEAPAPRMVAAGRRAPHGARGANVGRAAVKQRAPRPSLATFQVTITIGTETRILTGRAAEIIASVALHEAAINATPVGKAVIDFAEGQAQLELRHSFPPLRFGL